MLFLDDHVLDLVFDAFPELLLADLEFLNLLLQHRIEFQILHFHVGLDPLVNLLEFCFNHAHEVLVRLALEILPLNFVLDKVLDLHLVRENFFFELLFDLRLEIRDALPDVVLDVVDELLLEVFPKKNYRRKGLREMSTKMPCLGAGNLDGTGMCSHLFPVLPCYHVSAAIRKPVYEQKAYY